MQVDILAQFARQEYQAYHKIYLACQVKEESPINLIVEITEVEGGGGAVVGGQVENPHAHVVVTNYWWG